MGSTSKSNATSRCHYCESSSTTKVYTAVLANSGLNKLQYSHSHENERSRVLKSKLLDALKHQDDCRQLFKRLHEAEDSVRQASQRNTHLVQRLRQVKAKLSDASNRLQRKKDLVSQLPEHIEAVTRAGRDSKRELLQKKKAHEMALGALRARQAMEMDALYHFLPVRVSGVKAKTRQPMQVNVANLRLPEVASRAAVQMQRDSPGTSAALGYLMLHLELFCSIVGAPLLHESRFLGVHSSVWQAPTFWKRTVDPAHMLMLSAMPCDALTTSFIGNGPSWAMALEVPDPQHKQDACLAAGVRLLLRSAACACQHHAAQNSRALPMHWSPFAWLVLVAESTVGRQSHQPRTAWSLAMHEGSTNVTDMHACFMDCEQDDSEWNLVQTPNEVLPPPPSAVTDTEHWERAMFRDRQERMDRSGGVGVWQEKLSSWVSMRRREQS